MSAAFRRLCVETIFAVRSDTAVFGGSGLLAHTAKRCKLAGRVIYNDYDDYASRLRQITDTNRLRRRLAAILEGHGRNSRLLDAPKPPSPMPYNCLTAIQAGFACVLGFCSAAVRLPIWIHCPAAISTTISD